MVPRMLFRQLFDPRSSTYTYLLADEATHEAVLIDPVYEQHVRDIALVRELGLRLLFTLETHVHADHVTGAWLARERLGSRIGLAAAAGAEGADLLLREGDVLRFGGESLHVLATPGHTNGCLSYVTEDRRMAFTGDALLIRGAGRTDFQQGSAEQLYHSVHSRLFTLPADCTVYPGHDYQGRTASSVAEERAHNPRLGGERSVGDFVGYMDNLHLPHPKLLDIAVPANLHCGQPSGVPADAAKQAISADWGPVIRSYAGVPEVEPEWVAEQLGGAAGAAGGLTLVDVREPAELVGELGQAPGVVAIPLGQLRARLGELAKDAPTVMLCRSGGRSAQAALILEGAGFSRVANVRGGMIRWRALGLPVREQAQ